MVVVTVRLCLILALSTMMVGPKLTESRPPPEVKSDALRGIGSADSAVAGRAVAEMLGKGPAGFDEIRRANFALATVCNRFTVLINAVPSSAREMDEIEEAADYFARHDAALYLIEGFRRTPSPFTASKCAERLRTLSKSNRIADKRANVGAIIEAERRTFPLTVDGESNVSEASARGNLSLTLRSLIEQPVPNIDPWDVTPQQRKDAVEVAKKWLAEN